ncbi:MAG: hypothetical protein JST42_30950 [Bacteroidetes bacterium]|nr:hypothetical protein [Bacteroidota bacterium]
MIRPIKIADQAIEKLKSHSGLTIEMEKGDSEADFFINIDNCRFHATVNSAISNGNKVSAYSRLSSDAAKPRYPQLVISGYIPSDIAKEYADAGINYLDIAGNCHIRHKHLAIIIEGKKKERLPKVNQSRAFQETGVKLIFQILNDSSNLSLPYRKLAEIANVSLGSVGGVMQELMDLGFILETGKGRKLRNTPLLLDRWVAAYHDALRPRLILKRMRFISSDQYRNWNKLHIQAADGVVLWGGEPAASLLTNYLTPEKFIVYTNGSWQGLVRDLKAVPDDKGDIDVLEMFWNDNDKYGGKNIVPPLLIYADLMGSRIGRNVDTAKLILENELSNIIGTV